MTMMAQTMTPISRATRRLVREPRRSVLCNGGLEGMDIDTAGIGTRLQQYGENVIPTSFGGMRIHIPAADEVVPLHPRAEAGDEHYKTFHSFQRSDGSYVPGTLVIWEIYEKDLVKNTYELIWDPDEALRHIFTVDPGGNISGGYFNKGLRLIPEDVTDEEIDEIKAEARANWEDWIYKNDFEALRLYYEDAKRAEATGTGLPMPRYIAESQARLDLFSKDRKNLMMTGYQKLKESFEPKEAKKEDSSVAGLQKTMQSFIEMMQATLEERNKAPRGRPKKRVKNGTGSADNS